MKSVFVVLNSKYGFQKLNKIVKSYNKLATKETGGFYYVKRPPINLASGLFR